MLTRKNFFKNTSSAETMSREDVEILGKQQHCCYMCLPCIMLKLSTRSRSTRHLRSRTYHYHTSARVCPCFFMPGCPCFRLFSFQGFPAMRILRNLTRKRKCKNVRMRWVGRRSTDLGFPYRRRQYARVYGSQKGVNLFQRQRVSTFRARKVDSRCRNLIPFTSEQERMRDGR